ncbi:hypothetical protein JI666_13810 [Bacillus sp. NTK071]|uniref:hypothetical protein n=1 Tax=Bacillus sp. NTK071 TaxID=2802175 RepID=UPI001A8D57D2|nr:hypothetical protein [Bacillus sp. NTK071]MBN8209828.1 hypothetical protein [Bacillus sp. NTK071]
MKKKKKRNHEFLDTLLNKLSKLLTEISNEGKGKINIELNGVLRAYFDTNLVESYQEPLVIELDKLESMIKGIGNPGDGPRGLN